MQTPSPLTIHANLVVINNLGVLIQGKANLGKSTLTLALLDRGHQLVSDDATELTHSGTQLYGQSPSAIAKLIQINYLGLIDVTQIFGDTAYCPKHSVDLSVKLSDTLPALTDPFSPCLHSQTFLNISLPTITLPCHLKHLPLLVETVSKHYKLEKTLERRSVPHAKKTLNDH